MKILKTKILIMALMLISFASFSQTKVKGVLVDASTNEPLIGASVVVDETTIGTATGLDGSFSLSVPSGEQKLIFSYVGYIEEEAIISITPGQDLDLGEIALEADAINLNEVKVVASVAMPRETPVALSTIKPEQIAEKLGTQEYPEILKSTPGVYATKQGGGFGDSRVNIRGFDQRNTATMINGVPVNDMENGWVYWSNWAGLADVTRTMQVQRGLGASKVAVPSLGGTVNILTKTTDAKQGGNTFATVGNDNYSKYGFTFSTGLSENNWATTISLAKTTGDGYVDGTEFESYSYFMNISKRINEKHTVAFSVFGAPQWHGQRRTSLPIETFKEKGIRYNADWGYRNGEVYYLNKNFYHKPQGILNHFWTIDETSSIITAIYASIGTGGGTGPYGETSKFYNYKTNDQVDFDRIAEENEADGGVFGSSSIMRSSNNNHHWYGVLSSYNKEMGNLDLMFGIDGRYYKGEHYREVTDLLGGEFFVDDGIDVNNPMKVVKEGDKIAYYNDGLVAWGGVYGQAEYKLEKLTSFISISLSDKAYKRVDYFNYFSDNYIDQINANPELETQLISQLGQSTFNEAMKGQETDWAHFFGYMVKGGANYNLTDNHNIFFNTGYFERQPDFDAVYLNYINLLNDEAVNEKVFSFELGYGYTSSIISANLNAYYTKWGDKTFSPSISQTNPETGDREFFIANILGVDAAHMGVEMDFVSQPIKNLEVSGFVSLGDWRWLNDIEDVGVFDENQNQVGTYDLYVKDIRVGDAAQTTMALGFNYEFIKGLKIGADYNYYDNLYADFDVLGRGGKEGETNPDSWKMPAYSLIDVNLRYDFKVSDMNASIFLNVNNLLDTEYISDARDGSTHDWDTAEVYYGWGRSWSVGLKFRF